MSKMFWLTLFFAIAATAASIESHAHVEWSASNQDLSDTETGSCTKSETALASCLGVNPFTNLEITHATARAEYGHIFAEASTNLNTTLTKSAAQASASFEDFLTFTGPDATPAFLHLNFFNQDLKGTCQIGNAICSLVELVPITYGVPIRLYASVTASADGSQANSLNTGEIIFLSFFVLDAQNNPLPGIELKSESGTAYLVNPPTMTPVPEPATWTLLGTAMFLFWCLVQRAKSGSMRM